MKTEHTHTARPDALRHGPATPKRPAGNGPDGANGVFAQLLSGLGAAPDDATLATAPPDTLSTEPPPTDPTATAQAEEVERRAPPPPGADTAPGNPANDPRTPFLALIQGTTALPPADAPTDPTATARAEEVERRAPPAPGSDTIPGNPASDPRAPFLALIQGTALPPADAPTIDPWAPRPSGQAAGPTPTEAAERLLASAPPTVASDIGPKTLTFAPADTPPPTLSTPAPHPDQEHLTPSASKPKTATTVGKTAALHGPNSGQDSATPPDLGGNHALPQSWHLSQVGQPGSALTDTPLSGRDWGQTVATAAQALGGHASSQPGGDSQTPGGGPPAGHGLGAELSGPTTGSAEGPSGGTEPFASSLAQSLTEAYETLGTQVSVWSAAQTKRAHMTVDLGVSGALEVDVSLENGQAQLAFHTDDAQVRENLRTQATTVLTDLLAQAGIALGSLSVGQQGAGAGRWGGAQPQNRTPLAPTEAAAAPQAPVRLTRPQHASSGLDVYA